MTCYCNYTFVYDIFRSAFIFQRTFFLFSTVTIYQLLVFSIGQLFLPWLYDRNHIGRTGIAFTVFLLNILCNWLFCGKCLSKRSRKRSARFVDTAWLNGRLNQMMFLCLFFLLFFLCTRLYLKSTFLYPLVFNAGSCLIFDA